jgi:hypothetical protein
MQINGKELKDCIRIKEKRTFVLNVLCDCGGEFIHDFGDASSIFSSLFSAVSSTEEHKFNHKCRKCEKTAQFKHIFPCEKSFEVGLDTPKDVLANYVAESFEEELKDATGFEKSIG